AVGIAALGHEALDHAVEGGALVESRVHQVHEVDDRIGCLSEIQFEGHHAFVHFHFGGDLFRFGVVPLEDAADGVLMRMAVMGALRDHGGGECHQGGGEYGDRLAE